MTIEIVLLLMQMLAYYESHLVFSETSDQPLKCENGDDNNDAVMTGH